MNWVDPISFKPHLEHDQWSVLEYGLHIAGLRLLAYTGDPYPNTTVLTVN